MRAYEGGVLADYAPYTPYTDRLFHKLAELEPQRLAIMHGSSFEGDGAKALRDLAVAFREVFGRGANQGRSPQGTVPLGVES
ncbi:MAG: hypothetical protein R3344_02345 [Acidobacteriota bacterium]|nr:hypothetical protein [Acidobacteriota bacterium]